MIFAALLILLLGRQYLGEPFQFLCERKNIKYIISTAYHPRGNSIVERFNSTLGLGVRIFRNLDARKITVEVAAGYNNNYHSVLDCSPHEIVYKNNFFDPKRRKLKTDLEIMNERAKRKNAENLTRINRRKKQRVYEVGESVYVRRVLRGKENSLREEPCRIIDTRAKGNNVLLEKLEKKF